MNLKGRFILLKYIVFSFFILVSSSAFSERTSQAAFSALNALQPSDYEWIGAKIYQNEAASNPKYLTHWGKGEAFPSFGIAHFIWFPADAKNSPPPSFKETFPAMFELVSKNSPPPKWLERLWLQSQINPNLAFDAPWSNKAQFDAAQSSPEIQSLRSWLLATQAQQARFVVQGFEQRWLKETASLSPEKRHALNRRLQRMMGFKQGLFSAVDYFNFKGLGNNSKEQYQGKSWGLISVLEGMPSTVFTPDASDLQRLQAFITSAKHQLQQRTMLAPKSRNEARWIKGWFKRLDGYALEDNHE
ncbi:hypothetical protein MNBD_GAMMA04-997 [hydrothermal vent metagenome]|uniref:Uncharacterized protein n=1 Tax=hydrothermal vent metagenome TaxID=652676 RepID=A0A3B0WC67_9ZZZZ